MAIDLTPEQRAVGEDNFKKATERLGLTRRELLKAGLIGAGAVGGSAAAIYFGYKGWKGAPVRAALIGGGDEGGVLVGEHTPDFLQFVAVAEIRPFNVQRIFEGDPKSPLRKGFKKVYGGEAKNIKVYKDWREILKDDKIEAVVIALPLHLHAPVAIECMKAGKHVLCEKLMARNVKQCKEMIKVAHDTKRILSIGHQRHYSMLYAHSQEVIKSGILGDVKHIRALWHRNFSWPYNHEPKDFAWAFDQQVAKAEQASGIPTPTIRDGWYQPVLKGDVEGLEAQAKEAGVDLKKYLQDCGYDSVEQLIRWRLYEKTGGGLMAELGSHQLDACSIFLGKVKPLSVTGVGSHVFFGDSTRTRDSRPNPREIDDHIFVTFEFPGPNHPKGTNKGADPKDTIVVTYSSISTNGFEPYGECLMGTRGTMIVEAEQKVLLFTEKNPTQKGDPKLMAVNVEAIKPGQAAAESSSTWGGPAASAAPPSGGAAPTSGPVSRGYREEMEDFAYCVRNWKDDVGYATKEDGSYAQRLPRCHGEVAMADAIIALTANLAMKNNARIVFKPEWFDPAKMDAVPEEG